MPDPAEVGGIVIRQGRGVAWGALFPALALLVLGLLVDVGFTSARRNELRRLTERRDTLRAQLAGLESRDQRIHEIARRLGGEDLASALSAQQAVDPVNFLGRTLSDTGLHGLELGTEGSSQSGQVRRTRYFVRAEGSYGALQRFVQHVERGPRVLAVDGFTVEKVIDANSLDIRINLSLYEPLARL